MAQRKKSEIEFIQDTFCPQVAVLCSYDAEVICRKNSLTFVELVQPFCRFNGEIKITDPSNNTCTISNLRIEIKDINYVPPQPLVCKRILDEAVLNGLSSAQSAYEKQIANNNYNFVANLNTPWFESWREFIIKLGNPEDHEFLKHFVSCIFVVSTSHIDPLDQFQKLILQQQQIQSNQAATRYPKWFFPQSTNIYKYFVLLHDVQEGEISKAHQVYENLKNTYGSASCHLLQINSKQQSDTGSEATTNEPDPWLQYSKFNDFYTKSLKNVSNPSTLSLSSLTSNPNLIGIDNQENRRDDNENDSLNSGHPLDRTTDQIESDISRFTLSENEDTLSRANSNVFNNNNNNNTTTKRHGAFLTLSDHDRIKTFISEFLQRGLVPYSERTIKILNEQVQSKKSILKSFSIPRKLFGGSSSSSSSSASISMSSAKAAANMTNSTAAVSGGGQSSSAQSNAINTSTNGAITITNNFIAANDELQIRRLADLAFMFRLYDLAYNSYHTAKKDFNSLLGSNSSQTNSEQVLNMKMYLAGALEMATIASFMQTFANDLQHSSLSASTSNTSLSSLNTTSNKTYSLQYIDEAISLYANECRNVYSSIRAVLLSTEALKSTNLFLKAAYQFINLANDETDVRTALFLEQAALCYLAQPQPLIRKYAFFMSLAGHRYNKAGQKKHSLRVYKHALEIYENKGWFKAQDYINYFMSQLNFKLRNLKESIENLEKVLVKKRLLPKNRHADNQKKENHHHHHNWKHAGSSPIEINNQSNVLRDFIAYSNLILTENEKNSQQESLINSKLTNILLPSIEFNNIMVNLNPSSKTSLKHGHVLVNNDFILENKKQQETRHLSSQLKAMWEEFEEALYISAFKSQVPILFKPQLTFYDKYTDNKQMPKVVINETISVLIDLKNSLKTSILLESISLIWKFVDQTTLANSETKPIEVTNDFSIDNQNDPNSSTDLDTIAECSTINSLKLLSNESIQINLNIKPKKAMGHLHVLGIKYKFGLLETDEKKPVDFLLAKQMFEIRGARLNNNQQAMRSTVYDTDNRLNFKIINKTASMQIEMDHVPQTMVCNQLEKVKLFFVNNMSDIPIGNIKIASSGLTKSLICFDSNSNKRSNPHFNNDFYFSKKDFKYLEDQELSTNHEAQTGPISNLNLNSKNNCIYSLEDVIIKPNESYEFDMWIRAPDVEGNHTFYFMFFYEDFTSKIELNPSAGPTTGRTRSNSISVHGLKYRVMRYEFSIKTTPCFNISNMNILSSQANPNLFLNFEISNKQSNISFELVNLLSISDVWKVLPCAQNSNGIQIKSIGNSANSNLNKNESTDSFQQQFKRLNKKVEEITSVVLKAVPFINQNDLNDKLILSKSNFKDLFNQNMLDLDESVILEFIKYETKKKLMNLSNKCNYLTVNFVWKSIAKIQNPNDNTQLDNVVSYGLIPVNIKLNSNSNKTKSNEGTNVLFKFAHSKPSIQELELTNLARNLITVTLNCQPWLNSESKEIDLPSLTVSIELKNLSFSNYFEMAIVVKNLKNSEFDKKYLWLGSNRKFIRLKPTETKLVKFRLGFVSNGVYEIGQVSNDAILKMNLLDATSVASLDDILENNSLNTSNMSTTTIGDQSSLISIYIKNNSNGSYELFKRLNPFTVGVLKQ